MGSLQIGLAFLLILWIGVAIGGNMIAAPAKFTVKAVSRADLIRVGRAQFIWVGRFEILFATLAMILWYRLGMKPINAVTLMMIAIFCLSVQRFGLHPVLEERGAQKVHAAYILAEILKIITLTLSSLNLLRS